jgi:hypothetical protein
VTSGSASWLTVALRSRIRTSRIAKTSSSTRCINTGPNSTTPSTLVYSVSVVMNAPIDFVRQQRRGSLQRRHRRCEIVSQYPRETLQLLVLGIDLAEHRDAVDNVSDAVADGLRIDVDLRHIILSARLHGGDRHVLAAEAGEHDHRRMDIEGFELLEHLNAAGAGQKDIEQHAVGMYSLV